MDHDQITTNRIIGCAIEVHRAMGAGLLEYNEVSVSSVFSVVNVRGRLTSVNGYPLE